MKVVLQWGRGGSSTIDGAYEEPQLGNRVRFVGFAFKTYDPESATPGACNMRIQYSRRSISSSLPSKKFFKICI